MGVPETKQGTFQTRCIFMIKFGMDKVRNHMRDAGYQNNERFILIQCFNDVTAINYIAENHIVKKNTGSIYAAHHVGL